MLRDFYFPVSLGAIIRLSLGTTMVRWAVESLFMLVTSPFVVKYT